VAARVLDMLRGSCMRDVSGLVYTGQESEVLGSHCQQENINVFASVVHML
jgi:hypothetical protein